MRRQMQRIQRAVVKGITIRAVTFVQKLIMIAVDRIAFMWHYQRHSVQDVDCKGQYLSVEMRSHEGAKRGKCCDNLGATWDVLESLRVATVHHQLAPVDTWWERKVCNIVITSINILDGHSPHQEFDDMSSTDEGVAVFSLTLEMSFPFTYCMGIVSEQDKQDSIYLNKRVRIEKEQMSVPDPVIAVKMPPTNPVKIRMIPCHSPKSGITVKTRLFFCLFEREPFKVCHLK